MLYTSLEERQAVVAAVLASATKIWDQRVLNMGRNPVPIDWTETVAEDGSPLISGRLDSPHAQGALHTFMRCAPIWELAYHLGPCQQPVEDLTVPGRTSCVWRSGGVWVELWHPTPELGAQDVVKPSTPFPVNTLVTTPATPMVQPLASGRLPIHRRITNALTTKEK